MKYLLDKALALKPQLDEIRQTLHRFPEVGRKEYKTSAFIKAYLTDLGIEVHGVNETGVVGILHGAKAAGSASASHVVGFRSDIDALPITENTGCSFSSEHPGVMHACGHDVHMTSLLGAAAMLSSMKDEFAGEIRLFFQPDEEGYGGAQEMVDEGWMNGVEAVFGAHVDPKLPVGHMGYRYGKFYAASDMYDITVYGKSAHGAQPEKGLNALAAASAVAVRLTKMTSYDPEERRVVTVGSLHAGTVRNIIADKAEMSGIIRTLGPEARAKAKDELRSVVDEVMQEYGTQADVIFRSSYGGVVNTAPETEHVRLSALSLLDPSCVHEILDPSMVSEDFGVFIDAAKGSFYHLGAGHPSPLHSDDFLPDDMSYVYGAALHSAVILNYLK